MTVFQRRGWTTAVEVSFSEYGERGSIDILAARPELRVVAVCEVKSEIGSLEETNRVLDAKHRLAPHITQQRFGWRARIVGRVLIVPRDDSIRRVVARHERTMTSGYPARSREVRAWLRNPAKDLSGIWFVSEGP